jgi:hypothetical protein
MCGLRSAKQPLMYIKEMWLNDIKFFKANCFRDIDRVNLDALKGAGGGDPLLDLK